MATNQLSYWYTGQEVNADQMNNFSHDIYDKFTSITENPVGTSGAILNIGTISQVGNNITLSAGSFRFPNTTYGYLLYTPGIFGNAATDTIAVTGNGFIVARYTINPIISTQTNYTFSTSYIFVASINPVTDCIVCIITAGVISGYGNFLINTAATNAQAIAHTATNVALVPANIPSFLGSYYPDIIDNMSNGDIAIGGRLNGSTNQFNTKMAAVSGNIPSSQLVTSPDGSYALSKLYATNGAVNNNSLIQTNYILSDGTYRPQVYLRVNDPVLSGSEGGVFSNYGTNGSGTTRPITRLYSTDGPGGYFADILITSNGANGYFSRFYNEISHGNYMQLGMSPNGSNNPSSSWILGVSSSINTGIGLDINFRPYIEGNLATLGTASNSIAAYSDIDKIFTTGYASGTRPVAQFNGSGVATLADVTSSNSTYQFFTSGGSWIISAISLSGAFPAQHATISGLCTSVNAGAGMVGNATVDLVSLGILSTGILNTVYGSSNPLVSIVSPAFPLGSTVSCLGSTLTVELQNGSGVGTTTQIYFSIVV